MKSALFLSRKTNWLKSKTIAMKKVTFLLTAAYLLIVIVLAGSCQNSGKSEMPSIRVKENYFINSEGEIVVFRGVNISDPDKLKNDNKWTKSHFQEAKDWGANIIRLPVHPSRWRERGQEEYLKLLDEAVVWANELGLYLIIDWHSIGNIKTEIFHNDMYVTTIEETNNFWNIISKRYADESTVAMYELYNEPVNNGKFGDLTWSEWKNMNEDMIDIIRKNDPEAAILVTGFNWGYNLSPINTNPIDREGIAYVSHPYPQKREQPWEPKWQEDWGFAAEKYPVILTEIGFALPDEKGVHIPVFGDESYGNALVNFSAERGISWTVWCFDPDWSPVMFNDWDYTPSRQGVFFRNVMRGAVGGER